MGSGPSRRLTPGRGAFGCGVVSVVLMAAVAAAGESAADPGLGRHTWYPPWDAGFRPASGLVTGVLVVAYLLGGAAVGLGLVAVRRGSAPAPGLVLAAAVGAVAMLAVLPPMGSADHLSYAAYGRIAAAGADPYVVDPGTWRDGRDPVAGAVQPPWQHTRSVYGPVATALMAGTAWLGHGSLRLTVWWWQVLAGLAFLAVALALDRLTRADPRARARAAVVWTLNPVLLAALVLGGHLDVIAVAFAMGAIALAVRRPLLAGALLGAAIGSKITFGLFALAALWGLRHLPRRDLVRAVGLGVPGSLIVLVPAQVWAGPHTYSQLHRASRQVSLATPWRPLVNLLDPIFGGVVRTVVGPAALALGVVLAALLYRRVRNLPTGLGDESDVGVAATADPAPTATADRARDVAADAARAAVVLGAAWVLTTPYSLPWYDALVWAPLALLADPGTNARVARGVSALDAALLARLTLLSLAYVPGRVVDMSRTVERVTLAYREDVAPWLNLAVVIFVLWWLFARRRSPTPGGPRVTAPEPARSPR